MITHFKVREDSVERETARFTVEWDVEHAQRASLVIGATAHVVDPSRDQESFEFPVYGTCRVMLTVTSRDGRSAQRAVTVRNGRVLP